MTRPLITIEHDMDNEVFNLMVTSYARTTPAGPRLFRSPPHPPISFSHSTREAAQTDAGKLQAYLDGLPTPAKKKSRAKGAFSE